MLEEYLRKEERGVSPVIGVILMVAITVILAAVIGTFVLNLGSSVQSNVQAGASVECQGSDDQVKVTFTSNQNADDGLSVSIEDPNTATDSTTFSLTSVGDSNTYAPTNGDGNTLNVVITAVKGEQSTVISTKTCEL